MCFFDYFPTLILLHQYKRLSFNFFWFAKMQVQTTVISVTLLRNETTTANICELWNSNDTYIHTHIFDMGELNVSLYFSVWNFFHISGEMHYPSVNRERSVVSWITAFQM